MTVAFDAQSTATAGTGNFSFTHTPVGTPRAVVVFVVENGSTDGVTDVTYGGVAMTNVTGSPNIHSSGEFGVIHCFFLGASIPTGAQTVAITVGGSSSKRPICWTLTGADDTEIVDSDATINSDSLGNPSVTLGLGGRTCWCAIAGHSGHDAITSITPLTDWTNSLEHDFGFQVAGFYRYNTVSTADVTAGWTQTAEDATAIAVAISEVAAAGGQPAVKRMGGVRFAHSLGHGVW